MDDLILEVNLHTAEGLAEQAKLQHIVAEAQKGGAPQNKGIFRRPPPRTPNLTVPELIMPRLIPIDPPKSMVLSKYDWDALGYFHTHPAQVHYPRTYKLNDTERYRLAMPLYAGDAPACMKCHAGQGVAP